MAILTILVRHAKAMVNDDAVQVISNSGRMMQEKVNRYLKRFEIQPTELWTSPVLRAKQTAEMIAEEFDLKAQEELTLGELEMFDEYEITQKLALVPDESTIIIVTHGPQIMRLATYWLGNRLFQGQPATSSALFLEFPDGVKPGEAKFIRLINYSDIMYDPKSGS